VTQREPSLINVDPAALGRMFLNSAGIVELLSLQNLKTAELNANTRARAPGSTLN
jgi:hypothetical protein